MKHLNAYQLSQRWNVTQKTLANWRWKKRGPPYIKIEGRILYRLDDIEQFEISNQCLTSISHKGEQKNRDSQ
ncbi:helix-turn-helix domain-containing protein [Magnetococcales bacterium HHB-1]